jgi:hypothetical protein
MSETVSGNEAHPFGVAPLATIACPKCMRGNMVYGTIVQRCPEDIIGQGSWRSKAFCEQCRYEWYVCRDCPDIQQILDTRQKLLAHTYKFHRATHPLSRKYKARVLVVAQQKRKEKGNEESLWQLANINSTLGAIKNKEEIQPSTPDWSTNTILQQTNTPSRYFGGFPTAVLNCHFACEESTEDFANNYHRESGLLYLVLEAFYLGNKATRETRRPKISHRKT